MRTRIVMIGLLGIYIAILGFFWQQEWVYRLPTPVPAGYKPVSPGSVIDLNGSVRTGTGRPLFLHFFNPDCPCSRFNIPHFKSLVQRYGSDVDFGIVVINSQGYTVKQIQEKFGMPVPVSFDSAIAAACGVYSTPQAVIIDAGHKLYYRGNYNRNRYCSDEKSSYARIALDSLLRKAPLTGFDRSALTAYGCRLPRSCTRND